MLKQIRLEALADGIFAIVMTLLVIEIKVPEVGGIVTNGSVLEAVWHLHPFFLSYLLSFLLLFTYWRGHHYIASVLAKNIDNRLTTINALFFLFVALVPFSTLLLSLYSDTQTAIAIYGANIVVIGMTLYWMRHYILGAPTILNTEMTKKELNHGTVRILFPVYTACFAVLISFFNADLSLLLFTLAILFNLSRRSTSLISKVIPGSLVR